MTTTNNIQQSNNNQQHIAVLGAGIIGINCAIALQKKGYRVTVIDKDGTAQGCSKGNAGHFATEQVFPLAHASMLPQVPKMLLDPLGPISIKTQHLLKSLPWFAKFVINMMPKQAHRTHLALKALNQHALDCYQTLVEEAQCQHLLTLKGSLLTFEQTPLNKIQQLARHYQNGGVTVEILNNQQVKQLEPALSDIVNYGLFFPDVGHTIDPYQLCLKLADYAQQLGCEFIQENVAHISPQSDGVLLSMNGQQQSFDKLVIATGAWSPTLCKQLGYKLPMQAERGYHLECQQFNALSRPVASAERKFIITPMVNSLRLAGTVEYAALNAPANYQRAQVLFSHGQALIKQQLTKHEVDSVWMGARPSLPDSLPVICQAPKHSAIYLAFGHHHLGLTQGAITGQLICELVAGIPTTIDVSPFNIKRFN
ncbi:NAD(P)/FAD-dependent oxidoreductase [Colwellia sp. MEBiC06753]